MKTKKIIMLMLCAGLIISASGCKNVNENDSSDNGVVLKWVFPGKQQPDQAEVWAKFNDELKSKTGFTVDIEMVESGYDEKAKMMLASGEEFDICFTSSWQNDYMSAVNKGAYRAIDDYIDKNGELYKSMPEYVWDSIRVDGKLYGVPSYQLMTYQDCVTIAKEVADKCGFDFEDNGQVVTMEQAEGMMKTAQQVKPSIYEGEQLYPGADFRRLIDYEAVSSVPNIVINKKSKDLKVEIDVETQSYKDMLVRNREWYKKGYIREDILTATGSPKHITSAVFFTTYKPGYQQETFRQYGKSVVSRPLYEPYVEMGCGQKAVMAVSQTSTHPEESVKFLDVMHTDKDLYNLFIYGIEGKHYTKNDDDIVKLAENTGYNMATQWMFGNQFNAYFVEGQDTTAWEATMKNNMEAEISPLLGFSPDISGIQSEIAQCNSINSTYNWIERGAEDYDEVYNEYIQKLKAAGVETIRNEIQSQIDKWAADKQ